jgi:MOSC domain-containing protein YiiM
MPAPAIDPATFRTRDRLDTRLDAILTAAPKAQGTLDLIVVRPDHDRRETPQTHEVKAATGLPGDHWTTYDRDPDSQICMMMSGVIHAIAGGRENWAPAGDNLFIDMDLTPANMPPGTRFAIGTAEFIVTDKPHNGCQSFIDRYGRDAVMFVNTGPGRTHRLRGIYARVTKDGTVSVGDSVRKL